MQVHTPEWNRSPRSRIRLKAAITFSGSSQPPSCRKSFSVVMLSVMMLRP